MSENYIKHNFVPNYSYEIYRQDGSLRTKYEPEAKADCEGTFEVDINDKNGNLKSHEEHPIRSLQKGVIVSLFSKTSSNNNRIFNYRFKESSYSPFNVSSIIGSNAQKGGIFIGRKNGSGLNSYIATQGTAIEATSDVSTTQRVGDLIFNNETNTINLSMRRSNTLQNDSTSGTYNGIGIQLNNFYNADNCFCADTLNCTWNAGDTVRITYNFSFPTSNTSTITKNIIIDWFTEILGTNYKLKDKNEIDVATKISSSGISYPLCKPSNIYGASTNQIDMGIVLGDSSDSVFWEDCHLKNPIDVSELRPSSTSSTDFMSAQVSGNTCYCRHARNFVNISNHDITIREAGVYAYSSDTTYCIAQAGSFLLAHWLTGDVVVHPNETIRVYWKPTVIVS